MKTSLYSFGVYRNNGTPESMEVYAGKVLLIVNTATECGFRKQFLGMQNLYEKYKDKGFEVLAFPSNQFNQEPLGDQEMQDYCQLNYNVSYPVFSKIMVNGPAADPLFLFLSESLPGVLNTKALKWNFTKFLIDRNGTPIKRYSPTTAPEKIAADIERLL